VSILRKTLTITDIQVKNRLSNISRVVLVGSGKGGVGKSLVASGLALTLAKRGYKTGILDLDLHGASLPSYLGIKPPVRTGSRGLKPKTVGRLKAMSTALFTGDNPVPLREGKKEELVKLLFSLTDWGKLDFLVVDLPPSAGDEVLSAFHIFRDNSSLLLVTTLSRTATDVVFRLASLASSERLPVEGIVVNMAYEERGKKRIGVFGKMSKRLLEKKLSGRVLTEIPIDSQINVKGLVPVLGRHNAVSNAFERLTDSVVKKKAA
jgi:ATP-binding protein involved in chromosome partitioning